MNQMIKQYKEKKSVKWQNKTRAELKGVQLTQKIIKDVGRTS